MAPVGSGMPSRRVTSHPARRAPWRRRNRPARPPPPPWACGRRRRHRKGRTPRRARTRSRQVDDDARARGDAAASVREARREKLGDATGQAWPPTRVAVSRWRRRANEMPRESRTPRGARSSWHTGGSGLRPDRRTLLAETQSAARLFSAAPRVSRGRDADVDVARPRPRALDVRARARSTARTHSVGRVRPVGCEPSPRAASRPRPPALGRGAGRVHAHGRRHPGGLLRHRLVRSVRASPRLVARRRARGRRPARHVAKVDEEAPVPPPTPPAPTPPP